MDIFKILQEELQIGYKQVEAAVQLIDEGNTIPFIARYRKEATGSLNDEVLRNLYERLRYLRNLDEKKEQVLSTIRYIYAEVLELADRHDSGSCVGNDVWVQVPFSAFITFYFFISFYLALSGLLHILPIGHFLFIAAKEVLTFG